MKNAAVSAKSPLSNMQNLGWNNEICRNTVFVIQVYAGALLSGIFENYSNENILLTIIIVLTPSTTTKNLNSIFALRGQWLSRPKVNPIFEEDYIFKFNMK